MHNDHCHRVTAQLQLINIIIIIIYLERTTARASPIGIPRGIYSTYCKLE